MHAAKMRAACTFRSVLRLIALLRLPFSSVLLLGLLALLLWGACNNSSDAPACCGERVVRVDSLAALVPGTPPRLYLTMGLRNDDADNAKIESVSAALLFRGLYWSDPNEGSRREFIIPAKKERLIPMVLPLTDSLACDPKLLRQLQQALATGTAGDSTLQVELSVNVYIKTQQGYLQDSGQEFPLPAMRSSARPAKAAKAR
jgi:hypothetical protein